MLNYLDRLLIASMREPIKESIPMTDAHFGLLTTVFLFVYGILTPFEGYLADRCGRKMIIVISLFVWSIIFEISVLGVLLSGLIMLIIRSKTE